MDNNQLKVSIDHYFRAIDEMKSNADDVNANFDYEAMLSDLNEKFALLCEDFKIAPDTEKPPNFSELKLNTEHVYHTVGLKIIERIFHKDEENPCVQKQPDDGVQSTAMETEQISNISEGAALLQKQQADAAVANIQPATTVEVENSDSAKNICANPVNQPMEEVTQDVNLSYEQRVRLLSPIFTLRPTANMTSAYLQMILRAIDMINEEAQSLNYPIEREVSTILVFIYTLLDATEQQIWLFKLDGEMPTLDSFIEFLSKRVNQMGPPPPRTPLNSRAMLQPRSTSVRGRSPSPANSSKGAKPKQRSYELFPNPPTKIAKKDCLYCKSTQHKLCHCLMFKSNILQAKIQFVRNSKLCASCLSPKHTTEVCRDEPCDDCKPIKHNTILCPKKRYNY